MERDAHQLIAQHAETTRLLGVDFLPLGTPPAPLQAHQETHADPAPRTARPSQGPDPDASGPTGPHIVHEPVPFSEIRDAYEHLQSPGDRLEALRAKYESDAPHDAFATGFTNIVFGEGDPDARLMFIGEAPGQQEDETGRPFVGRAGQLLEKMIVAMGFNRQSVYICNVLKTRPPNNATPTPAESHACAPYLYEQIRIVRPEVIVTLGLPATQTLLQTQSTMRSLRGQWHEFPPRSSADIDLGSYAVMPTYHPAYLLRSYTEDNRRKVWSDLQQVQSRLTPDNA